MAALVCIQGGCAGDGGAEMAELCPDRYRIEWIIRTCLGVIASLKLSELRCDIEYNASEL